MWTFPSFLSTQFKALRPWRLHLATDREWCPVSPHKAFFSENKNTITFISIITIIIIVEVVTVISISSIANVWHNVKTTKLILTAKQTKATNVLAL